MNTSRHTLPPKWKRERKRLAVSPAGDELVVCLSKQFARYRDNRLRRGRRNRVSAAFWPEIERCAFEIEIMPRLDDRVGGDGDHSGRTVREKEHDGTRTCGCACLNEIIARAIRGAPLYDTLETARIERGFRSAAVSCVEPLRYRESSSGIAYARWGSSCRWSQGDRPQNRKLGGKSRVPAGRRRLWKLRLAAPVGPG